MFVYETNCDQLGDVVTRNGTTLQLNGIQTIHGLGSVDLQVVNLSVYSTILPLTVPVCALLAVEHEVVNSLALGNGLSILGGVLAVELVGSYYNRVGVVDGSLDILGNLNLRGRYCSDAATKSLLSIPTSPTVIKAANSLSSQLST